MSEQKLVEQPGAEKPLLPRQPEVNIGTAGHVDHGKCERIDQYVLLNGVPVTGRDILRRARSCGVLLSRVDGGEIYRFDGNCVVSLDDRFETVRAESLFYVENYAGPMYTIDCRTGRSLCVTPEHPLLINRKGSIQWVKARDVRKNDYAAFVTKVPLDESVEFPDPIPALKERYKILTWDNYEQLKVSTSGFSNFVGLAPGQFEKMRLAEGLSVTSLCRMAGISRESYQAIREGKAHSLDVRKKVVEVFKSCPPLLLGQNEFLVEQNGGRKRLRKLKDIETVDSDLTKWFAFVWAEGNSGPSWVDVTQTVQPKMLEEFLKITNERLGQEVRSYSGGRHRIYSAPFVQYLRQKFGFTPGNESTCGIADWVCKLPRQLKATFLRWFLTLDGEFNDRAGQVAVSQLNEKNIVIVSYLLHSFGIVPRFSVKRSLTKKGMREYRRVTISGRKDLRLFSELIGFEDPRVQKKLDKYLIRIKKQSKETDLSIPINTSALRLLFRKCGVQREAFEPSSSLATMKQSPWYRAYESAVRTGRISRTKLLMIVSTLEEQLHSIERSKLLLSRGGTSARRHMEIMGVPLEAVATELGYSRKKLTRILKKGSKRELHAVARCLQIQTSDVLGHTKDSLEQLRLLVSSALAFDRIVSVKREDYDGPVYDLTVPGYANFVAGTGALVSHNSTLTQSITGVWTSAHSEELRRGITIKVGYADAAFYKCPQTPAPAAYCTSPVCPVCGKATKLLRAVSFVDCPGHESLMTNMLAGAFLMDGTILVIAANEPVPQPQTREHLQALQMLGMKKIVIAQNKIDLVGDDEARKNREAIESFVSKTVAADAPIIPISAQQSLNIDALIEAIEDVIPTPKRDPKADPLMYVVRSFDVNRPGMEIQSLSGGVLGGSLVKGELRVGEEVEVRPGMVDERSGKFVPIITKVSSLQTGAGATERVGPGGLVAVGTHLDPTYTKGDQMVGSVIGKPGTLPPTWEHITLDLDLFETAVGSAEMVKVDKVKPGENLRLNLGTSSSPAVVTSARNDVIEVDLKKSVSIEAGMRAAVSRRIAERWRLIGSGLLK